MNALSPLARRATQLNCVPGLAALALASMPLAGLAQATAPEGEGAAPALQRQRMEIVVEGTPLLAQAPAALDVLLDGAFDRAALDLGRERLVKGAPYCADAVHETVQPLIDASGAAGNRIVRQTTTRLCRDGEGRTRQEVDRGGRKLVLLRDPVARESWVLDTERRTARRSGAFLVEGFGEGAFDASSWQDYAERMREWARSMAERARAGVAKGGAPAAPPAPPAPPAPASPAAPPVSGAIVPGREAELVFLSRAPGAAGDDARRHVEVQVLRFDGAQGAPGVPAVAPPAPPAVNWTARQFAPRGAGVVTSLGSKEIEGVRVNGERTTWTIEAGKVGNEKPIQIVRDVWTSPDLMLTVSSRDFDPRRGETSYRLERIRRGEPDAALMKVPADFARPASRAPSAPPSGRG